MQFFIRSSTPALNLKLVEHLSFIGSNSLNLCRNWFHVKDLATSASKLVTIDNLKSNPKKLKLIDIAYMVKIDMSDMSRVISELLRSVRHTNVLSLDAVDVNFYNDRVLFMQSLSNEGSLRDFLHGTYALDNMTVKLNKIKSNNPNALSIKTIQSYAKQIALGLAYLNRKLLYPIDTLHSGNVIMFNKHRHCQLAGYENEVFAAKTKQEKLNDDLKLRAVKSYLIRDNQMNIRKAKNEQEMKYMIQTLRFGLILIEMCTGLNLFLDSKLILPKQNVILREIQERYRSNRAEAVFFSGFITFIFFNRSFLDANEDKFKKKFFLPTIAEILEHEFLKHLQIENYAHENDSPLSPAEAEFLQYVIGNREIRVKKMKKKPGRLSSIAYNTRLSII